MESPEEAAQRTGVEGFGTRSERSTDQEAKDKRDAELDAQRKEALRRTEGSAADRADEGASTGPYAQ
jgi:hypothetical protein